MPANSEKINSVTAAPANELEREVTITRLFDAPRALVFQAWTDPRHLAQWWGPKGFSNPVCEADARPGGTWRIVMRAPDGTEYPGGGVYREIVEPERLVFTNIAFDQDGKTILDGLTTVTFTEEGRGTKLVLLTRATGLVSYAAQMLAGMEAGWSQSLERLEALVQSETADREIVATRVFDAPRALVWKAVTESERLMHWWGPKGFTMLACDVDLRPGGVFSYSMRAPNGSVMWGKWVYREIVAPERLVTVVSFTDEDGNLLRHPASATWPLEVLNTMVLTERDGKTTITIYGTPINATEEERKTFEDGRGSMKQGFTGTLDQLAAYLASDERSEKIN